jgi:hypothetical protein
LKEGIMMNSDQFEREKNYQASVSIARNMLKEGLIERKDFVEIRKSLVDLYKPLIGDLY